MIQYAQILIHLTKMHSILTIIKIKTKSKDFIKILLYNKNGKLLISSEL